MIIDKTKRKPNRLCYYDYSLPGSYFVTLCTQNRAPLFAMESTVGNGLCAVSNRIIHKWIQRLPHKYPNVLIDKYIIMPDHLHLIVTIQEEHIGCSLPDIMRFFKTMTTNEYIREVKNGAVPPFAGKLWQKSYYDHVIRNQQDYDETWQYIENNPAKWLLIHNHQP